MLQNIEQLRGYAIYATDGEIGSVADFYFDDFRWTIRYFVVVAGTWLFGKRVLISPAFTGPPDDNARRIPVSLSTEQVKNSPDIDTQRPVSRQQDVQMIPYAGWPAYGFVAEAVFPPPVVSKPILPPGTQGDPNLRSTNEVRGYHVRSTDGDVGKVEDFVFDESSWDIRFIVVDTGNWLKKELVLIAPQWIVEISWAERSVRVDVGSETIRESPPFYPVFPISADYAAQLYRHYGKEPPESR